MPADEFLTLTDLGARLQLSKRVLLRLVAEGSIPHKRIGKAIRFRWRDIEAWWGASERPVKFAVTHPVNEGIKAVPTDTIYEVAPLVRGHKRCKVAPEIPQ